MGVRVEKDRHGLVGGGVEQQQGHEEAVVRRHERQDLGTGGACGVLGGVG